MMTGINTHLFKIFNIVNIFICAVCLFVFSFTPVCAGAQGNESSTSTIAISADSVTSPSLAVAEEAAPEDHAAALFVAKCAGCHTIGGGELTGPDLLPSSQWPRSDMEAAIVRMEDNVGPLSAQEVQDLADLLMSGGARDRVSAEQQRAAQALAAQMEPGSPKRGKALFLGRARLKNGGPPCMACHQVNGQGGSLGVDLSDVHTRMGEVALISAIEGANFNVMRAAYANRGVTKQEAMHIAAWLGGAEEAPAGSALPAVPIIGAVAAFMAASFLAAMTLFYRRRSAGVRARLVQEASSSRA